MQHYKKIILSTLIVLIFSVTNHNISKADDERTAGETKKITTDASETYKQLNLFGDIFERVRAQYVEEVSDKELIESAINGMLSNLDPHSSYLNEEGFNDMKVSTKGEFGGLGIEVTMESGVVKVVSPIDDTPAYRAGVEAGDYITHIDGEPVMGLTLSEAVDQMRGKVGTPIEIKIRREGESEALDIKIIRDIIKITSIKHEIYDDIGYIRITQFNQNTTPNLKKAIKKIIKDTNNNVKGYVIDLRNNPGGLLTQAIQVSNIFLDKGEIVSTRGRNAKDTRRDNATKGDMTNGLPIVLIINGGSASASEIVAGAIQDHRRGIIIGTKSFGKGSVQTVIPVPGNGAMRLTTARYYTPSGRSIQAKGITPDIIVERAKIEHISDDQRTRESDLRGALSGTEGKFEKEENKKKSKEELKEELKEEKLEKDYQLVRAIDLIKAISLYDTDSINK